MTQTATATQASLRRTIFRTVRDPELAYTLFRAACATLPTPRARRLDPTQLTLPRLRGDTDPRCSRAARVAHDLQVLMTFLGAKDEDRARAMSPPGVWRLVQRLGGWSALHAMPRSDRGARLTSGVAELQRQGMRRTFPCPNMAPLRAATVAEVRALIARWQHALPVLAYLDIAHLAHAGLTLGALALIIERMAMAVEDGRVPVAELVGTLERAVSRCPRWLGTAASPVT